MAKGSRRQSASVAWPLLAFIAAAQACSAHASANERCRYIGTTDHAGHVAVTTDARATGGVTTVDVALAFEATPMLWIHIHYLLEEVSTWRAGVLESVAVNNRYSVGDHIVRQQWDDFDRGTDGLQARRVQAKTLAEFRSRYPAFVPHWDPATFGSPWIADYASASPERRPDLDLAGFASVRAALSARLGLLLGPVPAARRPGRAGVPARLQGRAPRGPAHPGVPSRRDMWRAPLRYTALSGTPPSTATAWTSWDGHLLQLAVELHTSRGSGRGLIRQEACGEPPTQADQRR